MSSYAAPRRWRPRYPGLRDADQSREPPGEPPAIHIIRTPDRDWSESRLREFATELRNTAQNRVLTAEQRRNCLQEAETAERYAEEKRADNPSQ